jgi:hypothetical protein
MPLQIIKPSVEAPTLNTLLYGPAKVGKTIGATSAPGPVLLLNADRPNASLMAHAVRGDQLREVRFEGMSTLVDVATEFQAGERDEKTIVLDSVGEAHRILLEEASDRAVRPSLPTYGDVSTHLERFCRALCDLPVNVVFVAHEMAIKDEESGHFERLPLTGTSNPMPAAKLMAMVDVIGYCGIQTEEGKEPRYVAQLFNGGGRRGGNRFVQALGTARELNLSEWVETVAATLAAAQNGGKSNTKKGSK